MTQSETPPVAEPGSASPALPPHGRPLPRLPAGGRRRGNRRLRLESTRCSNRRRCRSTSTNNGRYIPGEVASAHFIPAPGTGDRPQVAGNHRHRARPPLPLRQAGERRRWTTSSPPVRAAVRKHNCQRAILVGHNAHFDLNFLNAAVARVQHKRNPFHPFSVFDTVTLAGVAYGQTVLARAVQAAGFEWNGEEAHSAVYDAERPRRCSARWRTSGASACGTRIRIPGAPVRLDRSADENGDDPGKARKCIIGHEVADE